MGAAMNFHWDLEGMEVVGMYLKEFPVRGRVYMSRVRYGGGVTHYLKLERPIEVYEVFRDAVTLDESEVMEVIC
jgi:hypothetical protein